MGALDAEGVYIYDETDHASPVSSLLNLGQQSVSDALAALRLATTSPPVQNAILPSAPWVVPPGAYSLPTLAKRNGMVHLTSGMVVRSTALAVSAGTQYQLATVPPGLVGTGDWLPATEVYGAGFAFANSATPIPVYVALLPTGAILFQSPSAFSFGSGGGPTNSIRIPTISWTEP